jgi:hypothetical protein
MKAFNFQLEKSTPKPSLHITQLHNSKKRTLDIPNKNKTTKTHLTKSTKHNSKPHNSPKNLSYSKKSI